MQKINLKFDNLNLYKDDTLLIKNLSCEFCHGELSLLFGENNSGKTIISNILLGYLPDDISIKSGNLYFYNGKKKIDLLSFKLKELENYRKNIVGILQDNFSVFNDMETIYEQILNIVHWKSNKKKNEIKNEINDLIEFFNLSFTLNKSSKELKSNEEIILNFIVLLLIKPQILILDGMFNAMDIILRNKIIFLLNKIKKEALVIITSIDFSLLDMNFYDKVFFINKEESLIKPMK